MCRYRLGRAKSPDGQKSSDEEDGDKQKKTTSTAAAAGTSKASSSLSSTQCKNGSADGCDKKIASDKKSETAPSKNSSVQQKKDVDGSQQTDEGRR